MQRFQRILWQPVVSVNKGRPLTVRRLNAVITGFVNALVLLLVNNY